MVKRLQRDIFELIRGITNPDTLKVIIQFIRGVKSSR